MIKDTRRNALDRGLEILSILSDSGPLTFSALAKQTGAANTVLSRLLRSLVAQDWVDHQDDGCYAPGLRLRQLGRLQDPLPAVQVVLNALRDMTACTCLLLREEQGPAGPYVRCLAKASHEDGLGMQEVGAIRSSYLSHPWSWIFLDHHPADIQKQILAGEDAAVWLQAAWQAGLVQLHEQGYCQLIGKTNGKRAVPVYSAAGTLLAVIGLGWPGTALRAATQQQLHRAMLSTAAALARVFE